MNTYKNKYLKYKNKYLNYKNKMLGGGGDDSDSDNDKPFSCVQNYEFNEFIEKLRTKYLPILFTFIENLSSKGYTTGILIFKKSILIYKECSPIYICENIFLMDDKLHGLDINCNYSSNGKEFVFCRISWDKESQVNEEDYNDPPIQSVSEYLIKQREIALEQNFELANLVLKDMKKIDNIEIVD